MKTSLPAGTICTAIALAVRAATDPNTVVAYRATHCQLPKLDHRRR
jgi:hypothetical protein